MVERLDDWSKPGGKGFARTRGGMNQTALAVGKGLPNFALKGKDLPALVSEPRFDPCAPQDLQTCRIHRMFYVTGEIDFTRCLLPCYCSPCMPPGW